MHILPSLTAKECHIKISEIKRCKLLIVLSVHGKVGVLPAERLTWIRAQIGYGESVLLSSDGNGGFIVYGADADVINKFKPFDKLDWWEVTIPSEYVKN